MAKKAVLTTIADAITAELAAAVRDGKFEGMQFTPERSYADWDDDLKDLDCLRVDVVPVGHEDASRETRGSLKYDCSIDIGVREKFGAEARDKHGRIQVERVDRLALLIEEIHEFFISRRLTGLEAAVWVETKIVSSYDREKLRDLGLFVGFVRVTYRHPKAIES